MECIIIDAEKTQDTHFYYIENFLDNNEIEKIIKYLSNFPEFIDGGSRSQRWYQKDNKYFCQKWKQRYEKWFSFPYDNSLIEFEKNVISKLNNYDLGNVTLPNVNSCLINKYKDGNDYIKPHRDTH